VYPVTTVCTTSAPTYVPTLSAGTISKSVGTTYPTKTTTSAGLQVTGAAGRVAAGFEMAAAAAGLVAAFL
jgi:hypothetical protein